MLLSKVTALINQPMKVRVDLLLPHLRTGGIELNFIRLVPELRARGIDLRFVLQKDTGELRKKVAEDARLVGLNAGGMWATARAYADILCDDPPHIIHSATNAMNVCALLARRLSGARDVKTVIGEHIPVEKFLASRKMPWLRRRIMQATYPAAAQIVAPIEDILTEHRHILGRRCPPCTVLPNPVIQTILPPPALRGRARSFVALGRLSPEKGFDLALSMMAEYQTHDPQAHLTIYGDGPERATLEKRRDDLGLGHAVTFAGRTSDVAGALARADLFLCTSQVEGFGNAIVEAQAAGVPVLSVDCPFGPRLLLDGGAAGCLVQTRDPAGIAAQLASFADDPEARTSARDAAQKNAARYTIEASAEVHAAFFKSIAA